MKIRKILRVLVYLSMTVILIQLGKSILVASIIPLSLFLIDTLKRKGILKDVNKMNIRYQRRYTLAMTPLLIISLQIAVLDEKYFDLGLIILMILIWIFIFVGNKYVKEHEKE